MCRNQFRGCWRLSTFCAVHHSFASWSRGDCEKHSSLFEYEHDGCQIDSLIQLLTYLSFQTFGCLSAPQTFSHQPDLGLSLPKFYNTSKKRHCSAKWQFFCLPHKRGDLFGRRKSFIFVVSYSVFKQDSNRLWVLNLSDFAEQTFKNSYSTR